MIDERRIEEAKKSFIADKKVLGIMAMNDLACGFKVGAKWAINEFLKGLWHDASEKPLLRNGKCLVVYNGGTIDIFKISFVYEMLSNYGKDGMGWKCWCYVSDLFPKEGGKQ